MTESNAERIVRQMSEKWSTSDEAGEYALVLKGDEWRMFWQELQELIEAHSR